MKNKPSIFDVSPSAQHDESVLRKATAALKEKRSFERRKFWARILMPATAVAGLILAIRVGQNIGTEAAREDILLLTEIEEEGDFDVIADLEILEEIDVLEAWDESNDT